MLHLYIKHKTWLSWFCIQVNESHDFKEQLQLDIVIELKHFYVIGKS